MGAVFLAGLDTPRPLGFGPDNNLYVGSQDSNTVWRYSIDGMTGYPSPSPGPGQTGAVFVPSGSGGPVRFNFLAFQPTVFALTGTTFSATAAQRFAAVVGSFIDGDPNPGEATDYEAVIQWGDSSPQVSTGGRSDNGGGNYDIADSHTYRDAGTYTVTITLTDSRKPSRMVTAVSMVVVTP